MFSDILTPLPALGIEFDVIKGKGPLIPDPVRTVDDLKRLRPLEDPASLVNKYVRPPSGKGGAAATAKAKLAPPSAQLKKLATTNIKGMKVRDSASRGAPARSVLLPLVQVRLVAAAEGAGAARAVQRQARRGSN